MSAKKKTAETTLKTPMELLLGDSLLTSVKGSKISTKDAFQKKDLVALYFSAKWCPPCRAFSPVLKEFYKAAAEKGNLEIVYVSSDRTLPEFHEYYGTMPWLSLPEGSTGSDSVSQIKNKLAQTLQIQGIPALIVLDAKTGHFVTATARQDVTKTQNKPPNKCLGVIAAWRSIEPVPVEEAKLSQQGGLTGLMGIIFAILKNPIYIFGLLYFYKQFMKYLNSASGAGTLESIVDGEEVPLMRQQHEEAEF